MPVFSDGIFAIAPRLAVPNQTLVGSVSAAEYQEAV